MNINDWKVIQMRNDIKYIKKNIMGSNAANWSLVVDVFLVLLAFVLDRIFSDTQTINILWIVLAVGGVAIPLVLFIVEAIRIKRAEKISRRVLNTKELVEIFDDEICYMIMSADAFNKNLQKKENIDSRQVALLLEFYVIEAVYYLNKAVRLILKMDNNLSSVLDEGDISKNHISRGRLINAISLISSIYEEIFEFSRTTSSSLTNFSVHLDLCEAKDRYTTLKEFSKRKEEILEIDTKSIFKEDQ